ncbi:zf-HC2 domain-containing protein [Streptomyces sp. NBC_00102]|uniref:zf-HC2 domain-containing protein n=1 Tax=Streptomyces sp. NBC_00102 TaxID=2975652 RepID=UPI00224E76FE|nr:zf-HC2 domain-containing protein [Streptomyces sp. NBC_00102]MCX5400464.1 zf-HC2 domain-containing protein [Streptomyces sp. NBC_00102]
MRQNTERGKTVDCEHVRLSLAVRALSGLDAEEEALVRAHLRGCHSCRTEQESDARVTSWLSAALALDGPDAGLIDLYGACAATPPLPVSGARSSSAPPWDPWRHSPGLTATTLAVTAAVGGYLVGRLLRRSAAGFGGGARGGI